MTVAHDRSICVGVASRWTLRLRFVLCHGCRVLATTLREVTNSIIENQYLRLVLVPACMFPLPLRPAQTLASRRLPVVVSLQPADCSESFGYTCKRDHVSARLYQRSVLQIPDNPDQISETFVSLRVNLQASRCIARKWDVFSRHFNLDKITRDEVVRVVFF